MNIIATYFPDLTVMARLGYVIMFQYYGWVLFIIGMLSLLRHEYMEEIQAQFVGRVEWMFLEISVPRQNLTSTMAVENIFAQMHALHASINTFQKYMEGRFQLWYSLELVSLGGKVSFVIRTPKTYRHLVESAFYSQYPDAEIREVNDYMENFKVDAYNNTTGFDFFGTEWKMAENSVIPMKTYKDFEHPSAEQKIIDPLTNTIETMERIAPHEVLAMQILIQPIQNDEWEDKAKLKIKQLTGEEIPHKFNLITFLLTPVYWFGNLGSGHAGHGGHNALENKPRNNWLSMTDGEKQKVLLIEGKTNKPNFNTKIRIIYIYPKDQYQGIKRTEIIGALRHFSPGGGAGIHNTLKIDRSTWTKVDTLFSPTLEKPRIEWGVKKRKYWFLRGYKNRSIYIGSPKFLLSVEEIATLYHFPITTETTLVPAGVQAVASKKSRPPTDLPVLADD